MGGPQSDLWAFCLYDGKDQARRGGPREEAAAPAAGGEGVAHDDDGEGHRIPKREQHCQTAL